MNAVTLARTTVKTPIGDMVALASDEALCALEFVGPRRTERLNARLRRWFPPHDIRNGSTTPIRQVTGWLEAYFDGRSADISTLPLAMFGTPFEQRVWKALTEIPAGATTTYGAIAHALGAPGASRAVGLANGANPIAIVVPCHRVIGSSGALTGYGGGLDKKRWLLDHESRWRRDRLF